MMVPGIPCAVFRYSKALVVTQEEKILREDRVCGEEKEKKKPEFVTCRRYACLWGVATSSSTSHCLCLWVSWDKVESC